MEDQKRQEEEKESAASLRAEAEKRLARSSGVKPAEEEKPCEDIIHELNVHQIELEMQNEALRKAQLDLEESRDRYADLYDFAPLGYFTFSHKGIIEEVNLTGASLLGIERQKLLERGFGRFVDEKDLPSWDRHLIDVKQNREKQNCELLLKLEDGSGFYARLESVRTDLSDGGLVIRSIVSDITEHKNAERIRTLNVQLNHQVAELNAFAYSVAHDLRAPLRHMSGFIELLQKKMGDYPDVDTGDYMETINEVSKKMSSLIDNLLDFSRLGRSEMQMRKVNLNALVNEIVRETREELKEREIGWEIDELPDVLGDQALLRLVMVNLISNAVKFTSTRPQAKIKIGCKDDIDKFTCSIRDNGVGFDMKYAGKLFGVFQRLHSQNEFKGTGVGLANVKRIISRHGGTVWAEGAMGQGAIFYFTLPKIEDT